MSLYVLALYQRPENQYNANQYSCTYRQAKQKQMMTKKITISSLPRANAPQLCLLPCGVAL
jgi:hypothetical protein